MVATSRAPLISNPRGVGHARKIYNRPEKVYEIFAYFGKRHGLVLEKEWQPEQEIGLALLEQHAELFCLDLHILKSQFPHPDPLLVQRLAGMALGAYQILYPQIGAAEAVYDAIEMILDECGYRSRRSILDRFEEHLEAGSITGLVRLLRPSYYYF